MANTNKQADLELLPWYAKGELSPDDMERISAHLENSDALNNELELILKQIGYTEEYVESINVDAYSNQPERISKLLNRVREEKKNKQRSDITDKSEKNNLWTRLLSYLPQTQSAWKTAGAFALGVMIVQGIVISQLVRESSSIEYKTLSGEDSNSTAKVNEVRFLIQFNSSASILAVNELIVKYHLRISNGPDDNGLYTLVFDGETLDEKKIERMMAELESKVNVIHFIVREN